MPSLLVMALMMFIGGVGYYATSRYDPAHPLNNPGTNARIVAENALLYTGLLFQYANKYPNNQLVNVSSLSNFGTTVATPLLNYQSVVYKYNNQIYIINSWDATTKPGTNVNDVYGELMQLMNTRLSQGSNTTWQVPVLGINNSCSLSNYSYIYPNKLTGTLTLFSNICNQINATYGVKKYVLFEAVYNAY